VPGRGWRRSSRANSYSATSINRSAIGRSRGASPRPPTPRLAFWVGSVTGLQQLSPVTIPTGATDASGSGISTSFRSHGPPSLCAEWSVQTSSWNVWNTAGQETSNVTYSSLPGGAWLRGGPGGGRGRVSLQHAHPAAGHRLGGTHDVWGDPAPGGGGDRVAGAAHGSTGRLGRPMPAITAPGAPTTCCRPSPASASGCSRPTAGWWPPTATSSSTPRSSRRRDVRAGHGGRHRRGEKEMFSFTDRGGRGSDASGRTPGVLRAVLAAHLEAGAPAGQGESTRGDVSLRAAPRPAAYSRVLGSSASRRSGALPGPGRRGHRVAWRFYEALGVTGLSLQVNTLGTSTIASATGSPWSSTTPRSRTGSARTAGAAWGGNPLRLLDCKRDSGLVAGAPQIGPSLSPRARRSSPRSPLCWRPPRSPSSSIPAWCGGSTTTPTPTFELWHESLQGAQNALGGGGRYERSGRGAGFPSTPGSGYALGVERTLAVCLEQGLGPAARREQVVVLGIAGTDTPAAAGVARDSPGGRDHGRARRLRPPPRPQDDLSRRRQGARAVVLVGEDEAAAGNATWTDLDTGRPGRPPRFVEWPARSAACSSASEPEPHERSAPMSAQRRAGRYHEVAPRPVAARSCGWTNRKDTGNPHIRAGLRAPLTGKEKSAVPGNPPGPRAQPRTAGTGAGSSRRHAGSAE